ncbi:MAG: M20/M25/M40 family metallo-hydrolase [Planctomycetaceae bacterium]
MNIPALHVTQRLNRLGVLAVLLILHFSPLLRAGELELLNAAVRSIKADTLKHHTLFLASDTLEGREAGSTGGHAAGAYLLDLLKKSGLKPKGDDNDFVQAFGDDYRNLLAYIPGDDPQLKHEVVLIGAHYDHVGYGTASNSFGPLGQIHNGADDNASGVSGLVEVIEALTQEPLKLKRSVMIAFWDGEEKGLLGSEHWVDAPTVPLENIRFYVNIDMIGRLANNRMKLYGVRSAPGLRQWVAEQNQVSNVQIDFDWTLKRDSDHYPFYQHQIPFFMLHTGLHEDYHRPSDDPEKLNWKGMEQVSRLMFQILYAAAQADKLPAFRTEVSNETPSVQADWDRPAPAAPPRLGIAWNRDKETEGIIEVILVAEGSPAEQAGFKVGDRILKIGATEITAETAFIRCVNRAHNPVEFHVQRAGETAPLTVTAQLNGSPLRLGAAWRTDAAEPGVITLVRVDQASPADLAGLKLGDRISQVAGERLKGSDHFRDLITTHAGPLDLLRERAGQLETVTVKFDDDPVVENKDAGGE